LARFANSVQFTPVSAGTVDFVVSAAVPGFMTPALAGAPSGVYKYRAESTDLSQWEIGEGTYTSGTTTLTRTTVLYNSAGTGSAAGQSGAGTKINFTVAPNVGLVQTAEDTIGVDQSNSFTSNQKAQIRANQDVLKYNYILNGAMMVSQENGASALTVSGNYPVDQFILHWLHAGTPTFSQVFSVTPGNSPNRIRVTATVADASVGSSDFMLLRQSIEGLRVADLRLGSASAKTITVQFGVKAPAGTYVLGLRNAASNRGYAAEYTISAPEANTDVVKSVTIALDQSGTWATDTTVGLELSWWMMAGSSFYGSASVWGTTFVTANQFNLMGTVSNVFELFDVSVTEGSVAPAFQVPDFVTMLNICKRYWEKSYDYPTPVGNATLTGANGSFNTNLAAATHQYGQFTRFEVEKRIGPAVTVYSTQTGAAGNFYDAVANANVAATVDNVGTKTYRAFATGASATTYAMYWHHVANARL
jgi:hypothetical protein